MLYEEILRYAEKGNDMKKRIIAVVAAALIMGVGAGTSYAYLTGQDEVKNTFQASKTEIVIEEEYEPAADPKPGTIIKKAPKVVSQSSTDCYVRMMVQFSDNMAKECCEPLVINSGWNQKADGYYYWNKKVAPGECTGTLFDKVEIRSDINEENLTDFDILVYAEAVQCGQMEMESAWASMDPGEEGGK